MKKLFSFVLIAFMLISMFAIIYSPIPIVHATTSWTSHVDDFETGSVAAFWNVSQGTAYVVGLSWDLAYGGRYGCESVYGTEADWFYNLTATGTLWFSFMFKIATEPANPPATSTTVKLFSINYTDGGTGWFSNNISIVTGSSPTPQFRIIGNDAAYDEGSHTIYKHTWYFVKVSSAISGTTITTTLYVDNAIDCSLTKTGLPSGTWQHSRFYLHGVKWGTGTNARLDNFGESTTEPTLPYFATVGVRTTALWVDSFSATEHQWTNNAGSSPYLSVVDYAYATNTLIDLCTYWPLNESWFGFQDLPADSLSIVSVYAFQVTFSATYGVWNWAYWKNSSSSYQEGFFYSTWLSGWQLLPAKDSGGQGAVININHTYPTVAEVNSATFRMSDWRTNNNQNGVAVDGMFLMVTYTYEEELNNVVLDVSSYPEINALFNINGVNYSTPQSFTGITTSECIINGGFEDAPSYVPWTMGVYGELDDTRAYSGSWSCKVSEGGGIRQDFVQPVLGTTINSWGLYWYPTEEWSVLDVFAYFMNGEVESHILVYFDAITLNDWNFADIREALVTTGPSWESIEYIGIHIINPQYEDFWIDDVSLIIGVGAGIDFTNVTLEALEDPYKACKWIFSNWVLNGTISIFENPWTITVTANTTMTMIYTQYAPAWVGNSTTLNIDGDLSQSNHTTYWNPHEVGTIYNWNITYGDNVTLIVDSNFASNGHVAAGTWYYTWNTTYQAREPLLGQSIIVDADIRIKNVSYATGSWVRVAIAAAFCDPDNVSGHYVKYVEMDIWDSPAAANHSAGDAAGGGNVIFSHNDVVEWRYDNIYLNYTAFKHYQFNLTRYIEAAWGTIMQNGTLESVYLVIECIGTSYTEVEIDNFWLRIWNTTDIASIYSIEDTRNAWIDTQGGLARWSTVMTNISGTGVFFDLKNTVMNNSMLGLFDDDQYMSWQEIANGTSQLILTDVTNPPPFNGTDDLKVDSYRGSPTDDAFMRFYYTPSQNWSSYDFLIFYILFNKTETYYHKVMLWDASPADPAAHSLSWFIKDTNDTLYDGWSKVTIPIRRPTLGSTFNYGTTTEIEFHPVYCYENYTVVSGYNSTVYVDTWYLDKANYVNVTLNVPINTYRIGIWNRVEITGYEGKYVRFAGEDGESDPNNFVLLRPRFFKTWAPNAPYGTSTSCKLGYSLYAQGENGTSTSVIVGDNLPDYTIPSGGGWTTKVVFSFALPPYDGFETVNGSIESEFSWGGISELRLGVFFFTFNGNYTFNLDLEGCGNWVFAEERFYNFNTTVNHSILANMIDTVMLKFNVTTENGTQTVVLSASELDSNVDQLIQYGVDITPFRELKPVETQAGSRGYVGAYGTSMQEFVNLRAKFMKYCQDIYLKNNCVSIYIYINDTMGSSIDWDLISPENYFRIYNKGGFSSTYNTYGNAYRILGGDVFDFYASNGSWVESDVIFHNLQHIKILPRLNYKIWSSFPSFVLTYRMDYCLAGENTSDGNYYVTDGQGDKWIRGWGLVVSVNYAITGGSHQFANYTISFKYNDTFVGDQLVIHAYMDGNIQEGGEVHSRLWFDYWFNRVNASSTVGARSNAYEYAMKNGGNPWLNWLTGGDWGPNDQLNKEAMLFTDLKDSDGNVISAGKVKMMRFYVRLETDQSSVHNQTVTVHNYQIFDLTFGKNPFEGIQTPTFEDTIIPTMNRGSLLGTIFSALASLGAGIWNGLSFVFGWIWGALTGVFAWLMPYLSGAFNSLWNWLLTIPYIGTFLGYVADAFTWMTTMVTQLVGLIVVFFSFFVQIVSGIFQFIQAMVSVFTIMFVTYGSFIPVIVMVVMIELFREGAEEGNWTPLIDTFTMVFGAIMFMIDWGFKIISFVADRIMGGLPI